MELYTHQEETASFIAENRRCMVNDDPGCGKTIATIEGFLRTGKKRMLVLAPLSILRAAWGDDIERYSPDLSWAVARGAKRSKILEDEYDIVITNHDSVNWLIKEPEEVLRSFDMLVIDESTVFKNKDAARSKAAAKLTALIDRLVLLTGTPTSKSITDIWHQIFLLDRGERLGRQFFKFRVEVCTPTMVKVGGGATVQQWEDKEEAESMVAGLIGDITIRHKFEDCLDIPENKRRYMYVDLPPDIRRAYNELLQTSALETAHGNINAIHAGARYQKILQLLTGTVYNESGEPIKIHNDRYELVMELVSQREKTLVGFNWRHEREALCALAKKMKIKFGVIDGTVKEKDREKVVNDFQKGDLQVVFAHPQSAGHGLTFTAGTTTIWASASNRPEAFQQFNRRIYRAGQTKKTETICICARDTKEEEVYERLDNKLTKMEDLLGIFVDLTNLKLTA